MEHIKYIDLFAGIGGIRIPFQDLKYECVFSSEWDKHCQTTYFKNFQEMPFGDINAIDISKDIPKHNLLLAGFPCQPFSQAGLKKGFADTRGTLFFKIAEILNLHRPEVVLLENVKRFRTHDSGNTFKVIKAILNALGYTVFDAVLNAKDFGVPQNRERIYIVGLLGYTGEFRFPTGDKHTTKLGLILEKNVDKKYTISDKLWSGHLRRKAEHLKKGYGFGYKIFNEDSAYTSTISARYYKDGSEILIEQKDGNPRKLTPKEASRLQGFPESFIIHSSDTQAYKQFGNSVAVPVIREIAKKIDEVIPSLLELKEKKHHQIDLNDIIIENGIKY